MTPVPKTRDLVSIGTLAGRHCCTVRVIEHVITMLKLRGVWRINGVVHFDGGAVARIVAELGKHNQRPQARSRRNFQ
jgi:hypothetical protein